MIEEELIHKIKGINSGLKGRQRVDESVSFLK